MSAQLGSFPAVAFDYELDLRPAIVWIGTCARLDASEFGWKAANLCTSAAIEKRTPTGFALSRRVVARVAHGKESREDRALLQAAWQTLSADGRGCPIVRSSSAIEHTRTNSFAGLFETVRNVKSFDDFIVAIRRCHASGHAPRVERYAALRGTPLPVEHMAVLVQRQVSVQFAALIQVTKQGYLFEAYEGDLSDRIQGEGLPDH